MPLTSNQTKVCDLRSSEYTDIISDTDGVTTHSAGDVVQLNNAAVFTLEDVPINTKFTGIVKAEKVRVKKAAVAVLAGENAYYDLSTTDFTNVSTGNNLVGTFLEDAALGDADALIDFNGENLTLV